ncbi:metal-dependent hydrolase [Chthonobacter rhizosphaerae]|uniref:metal-dependent hydrolase n=1 Tax=Chthonobacter rhizosphaerae TaxID=2735553 RepID=UPI0015EF2FEB|nr:metal-dependent hydrolase [Chthonobacter rhizosphaerae]
MDPVTQGAIGAALPASVPGKRQTRVAAAVGFLAGMAADLDVLIRSRTDSLLFLEYHRQFTHSLIFIPVGGLLVAAVVFLCFRRWLTVGFARLWLFSSLGYGTHGLLDAATSYGTLLFWPFSDRRFSSSIVSIVDPLFTLPVLALVAAGVVRRSPRWARFALVWAACYLAVGAYQHQAAEALAHRLARERGHVPVRLEVKPTFANLIVWRSIYETEDRFHVDAIRPGFAAWVFEGASIERLDVPSAFPWLDPSSQQARDVERFTRFSDGFVAKAPDGGERIIDVRYAFLPTAIAPLWSIRLDRAAPPTAHVRFETHRNDAAENLSALMAMVLNRP